MIGAPPPEGDVTSQGSSPTDGLDLAAVCLWMRRLSRTSQSFDFWDENRRANVFGFL